MKPSERPISLNLSRRQTLAGAAGLLLAPSVALSKEATMKPSVTPKAFVYTEVAISVPFDQAPWQNINVQIKKQPGFLNKTWLHGDGTQSIGGLYAFDSIENARGFVTGYFPSEPRGFGVAHNTRVFDADVVAEASRDLGSPHFGETPAKEPGAFVYTELQFSLAFDKLDWKARNAELKATKGLQNKLWLSGVNTHTLGGFDAFDTVDQARDYAINQFPEVAARLGAAFYTRIFDANVTRTASIEMNSPYYA